MCPVTSSSRPSLSMDNTASAPPLPSRRMKPSGSGSLAPTVSTISPSSAATAALISLVWLAFASVQTAIAISPVWASNNAPSPVCNVQCPLSSNPKPLAIFSRPTMVSPTCFANSSPSIGNSPAASISMPESTAIAPLTVTLSTNLDNTTERSLESRRSTESPLTNRPCASAGCSNASGITSAIAPRPAKE